MTDAIAKAQAMVGCPHYQKMKIKSCDEGLPIVCKCGIRQDLDYTSVPAPDCSTLDGAVKVYLDGDRWSAHELGNTIVTAYAKKGNERTMATAVCELILKGVEGGE